MAIFLIISNSFHWLHFHSPGKFLSMLPVDPKLGKMLIMGAIFRCFDPVLTIVAGLSVRDPFLLPQDKRDVSQLIITFCCIVKSNRCIFEFGCVARQ